MKTKNMHEILDSNILMTFSKLIIKIGIHNPLLIYMIHFYGSKDTWFVGKDLMSHSDRNTKPQISGNF